MKKLLTLALAIVALAVFTGLSVVQGAQQKDKQKSIETKPSAPQDATTTKKAPDKPKEKTAPKINEVTGTVTEVNEKGQTFTLKTDKGGLLTLSFSKMKGDFTRGHFNVRDRVDVTYPDPPKPGDPPAATTVKGSRSNTSEIARVPRSENQMVTGTVTNVDEKAQTFTVKTAKGEQLTFSFSAKQMPQPKKDEQVDVTYIQNTPGGPMEARTVKIKSTKSNASERLSPTQSPPSQEVMTGTVTKVNDKAQTFTVTANGKEVNFSGKNLKAPFPKVGDFVDVTYTDPPKPGDPPAATTVRGSKSNSSERVASPPPPKMMTGEVTKVDEKAQTFTIRTKEGKEVTFSRAKRIAYGEDSRRDLLQVGSIIDVTYTENPGGPMEATTVNTSKSNTFRVANDVHSAQQITGKVLRVSAKDKTFTVMAKGKEVTFDGTGLKALPVVGTIIDVTYTQTTPGGTLKSTTIKGSKSVSY